MAEITNELIYEELLKLHKSIHELSEDMEELRAISGETVRIVTGQKPNDGLLKLEPACRP